MNKAWGRPKNNQNKPNRADRRNPKVFSLDSRILDGAPGRPGMMTISIYYGTADVRYPNEVKTIREDGGVVWRIRRPGLVPTVGATHTSEALALGPAEAFDGDIDNDGTIDDLAAKLKPMLIAFGWPIGAR